MENRPLIQAIRRKMYMGVKKYKNFADVICTFAP